MSKTTEKDGVKTNNDENKNPIVYCWRYENQPICKIGVSSFHKFYDNAIKPALRFSVLDIQILGICLCNSIPECYRLEKHLLDERFDRVHPSREFVHLNRKVWDWIHHGCVPKTWTVEFFKKLDNDYRTKHRERSREYQREKRSKKALKTRARNMYREWALKPLSPLTIAGPTAARVIVTEELENLGVEPLLIKEWLDEFYNEIQNPYEIHNLKEKNTENFWIRAGHIYESKHSSEDYQRMTINYQLLTSKKQMQQWRLSTLVLAGGNVMLWTIVRREITVNVLSFKFLMGLLICWDGVHFSPIYCELAAGLLMVQSSPYISFSGSNWTQILLIFLVSMLYVSLFFLP